MTITIHAQGAERKRLVKTISDWLGVPAKYCGAPTFSYEVDYFTIDRNGSLSFDDRADSEENVNDAYLHAWEAMPPQRPAILSAFLGRITRNLALNRCKAANAQKRQGSAFALLLDELDDCAVAHPDPESATAATMPSLTTDYLGSENAGLVCSLVMIGFGVASIGTSFLAKAVNTSMAFILAGVIAIVGILVTLALPKLGKAEQ